MNSNENNHRALLVRIAHQAMQDRGLLPDFSSESLAELSKISVPAINNSESIRDLKELSWISIDNESSRDLDQLTYAMTMTEDRVKILVAIADVDALVKHDMAIDEHARHNTTSVYTAAIIFPMLPEKLSTDLSSLNLDEERLAVVVEMIVGSDGALLESDIYRAVVRNHARLAYNSVAAWLEGSGDPPDEIAGENGLTENLRLQDKAARRMRTLRHAHGALNLETIEATPLFDGDHIQTLELEQKNRAKEIIEDFMIAANGVVARYLSLMKFPSIRRVVRTPKRWDRIVELAQEYGYDLPDNPDPKALEKFLESQRTLDPVRFPDLSLAVIKLLGAGEYVVDTPEEPSGGHFGLAVKDYTHSTAPNRRYTDLITHRLLKAALEGEPLPYSREELEFLAKHCTAQEDAANKVERQVGKSAVALLLESRVGEQFNAIVTGASQKGTWVRLLEVPVEGKLVKGFAGLDVGQQIHVRLIAVNVERGFIDFERIEK